MAIQRCKNGHYYNDAEAENCPYCTGTSSIGTTIPLGAPNGQDVGVGKTLPLNYDLPLENNDLNPTRPPVSGPYGPTTMIDENKTSEIDPVRGWIVVIQGEKVGLDFRIHSGKNTIGRAKTNDICIDFDATISKEKACFIIYDQKNNEFYLMAGESTNNIYVNTQLLLIPRKLCDNDILEIGKTKLVFRSLCNEQFTY